MDKQKIERETVTLSTLSQLFDIPLWSLRKYASQRRFPGIIKKGRIIFVDLAKFRAWWYQGEIPVKENGGQK